MHLFKRHIVFLLLILVCFQLKAQIKTGEINQPQVDDKKFHFGFLLGMNEMDFGILNNLMLQPDGNVYLAEVSNLQPGFTVGIIGDLRLQRYFNLRTTPSIHFGSRILNYSSFSSTMPVIVPVDQVNVNSVLLDVPLLLKFSAERHKNMRPYLITGAGMTFDLAKKETSPVILNSTDFYVTVGLGSDIYFPFFKLAPELKFSFGLSDILNKKIVETNLHPEYTHALDGLTSRLVILTFNIE